ncbi:MAG: CHAT domain-containing protein, partial [Chitinophagaceae bacterium]|nr:CHAT domain-containing protein [Chitinophagaceae bacterium]
ANAKVRSLFADNGSALIEHVEFVELYEDVALSGFQALNKLEKAKDSLLAVNVEPKKIVSQLGTRKRLPSNSMDEWWTRITVKVIKDARDPNHQGFLFTISTGGAREEQRILHTTKAIIDQLVSEMSTDNLWTPALAKTLFELLIPTDFKDQIKRQNNINWIVDEDTAPFPWELLQDGTVSTAKPLCVNAGMIRQYATEHYRLRINAVTSMNALVVGDPNLKGFATQLPGAKDEGKMVAAVLQNNGFNTTTLINESSFGIIQALFSSEYKIIHLAGHGVFNPENPKASGMLIGDGVFLSTREINQMSTTPEFVFVNCCFLGKNDAVAERLFQDRLQLAANIGTQLINNGVKAVIAAGWAVDDSAALDFTASFYQNMFEGYSLGEAVKRARQLIYEKYDYTNTWGAYQCYGDQYYRFNIAKDTKPQEKSYVISEEAEIELHNLQNMAETGQYTSENILSSLEQISAAVDKAGLRTPVITEAEAFIFGDLYEYDRCITKLETLFQTERAAYSVAAFERYCNIRAGKYSFDFLHKKGSQTALLSKMSNVIRDMEVMLNISPTSERMSIMASAYKRKGLLSGANNTSRKAAYQQAADYYRDAYVNSKRTDGMYPLSNWIAIESLLRLSAPAKASAKAKGKRTAKEQANFEKSLERLRKEEDNLQPKGEIIDYWDLTRTANAKLALMIASPSAAQKKRKDDLFTTYKQLWEKAGSKGKRMAELEHLSILLDVISLSRKKEAVSLKAIITELKKDLEKIAVNSGTNN